MSRPVVIVSGFGRCGSSVVMQMLEAGGFPCVGDFPSFEDMHVAVMGPIDRAWFLSHSGRAMKVLDPHQNLIPRDVPVRAIWLDRDVIQQARSHAKFLRLVAGMPIPDDYPRNVAESLRKDRPGIYAYLGNGPVLTLTFERVLAAPAAMAAEINRFVCGHLDESAMAKAVRWRPALCAPGMDMELSLIAERRA